MSARLQQAVRDLFVNGAGQRAARLVLTGEHGRDLGGWCEKAIMDRILAATVDAPRECRWVGDANDDVWKTGCGNTHQFTTDGPTENGHRFCPYCGAHLVVTKTRLRQEAR